MRPVVRCRAQPCVGQLEDAARLSCAQHVVDTAGSVLSDGPTAHTLESGDPRRVPVSDRDARDTLRFDEIDRADVGESRDDEVGQVFQRRAQVERTREDASGVGEDFERAPPTFALRDVAERHARPQFSVRALEDGRGQVGEERRAVLAAQSEDAAGASGASPFLEQPLRRVVRDDYARAAGGACLLLRAPEQSASGGVRVEDAAVGRRQQDSVGRMLDDRSQRCFPFELDCACAGATKVDHGSYPAAQGMCPRSVRYRAQGQDGALLAPSPGKRAALTVGASRNSISARAKRSGRSWCR